MVGGLHVFISILPFEEYVILIVDTNQLGNVTDGVKRKCESLSSNLLEQVSAQLHQSTLGMITETWKAGLIQVNPFQTSESTHNDSHKTTPESPPFHFILTLDQHDQILTIMHSLAISRAV